MRTEVKTSVSVLVLEVELKLSIVNEPTGPCLLDKTQKNVKSVRKAGKRGGGKIPGTRSAQRGPEISVKCSYRLSSLYVCPK
jgi:hypothetical protein